MKASNSVRSLIVAWLAACVLAIGIGRASAAEIIAPDCRVDASGVRSYGVKVDVAAVLRAKRPTKSVYVEEAVALWRPAAGELIAANEAPGTVSDINAAVAVKETVEPKPLGEMFADHLKRRWKVWAAGVVVAGVGLPVSAHNDWWQKSDGGSVSGSANTSTSTATDSHDQTSTATVTAGDYSPVTIIIYNGQPVAMPPE